MDQELLRHGTSHGLDRQACRSSSSFLHQAFLLPPSKRLQLQRAMCCAWLPSRQRHPLLTHSIGRRHFHLQCSASSRAVQKNLSCPALLPASTRPGSNTGLPHSMLTKGLREPEQSAQSVPTRICSLDLLSSIAQAQHSFRLEVPDEICVII